MSGRDLFNMPSSLACVCEREREDDLGSILCFFVHFIIIIIVVDNFELDVLPEADIPLTIFTFTAAAVSSYFYVPSLSDLVQVLESKSANCVCPINRENQSSFPQPSKIYQNEMVNCCSSFVAR
jgi:hypothetical protein